MPNKRIVFLQTQKRIKEYMESKYGKEFSCSLCSIQIDDQSYWIATKENKYETIKLLSNQENDFYGVDLFFKGKIYSKLYFKQEDLTNNVVTLEDVSEQKYTKQIAFGDLQTNKYKQIVELFYENKLINKISYIYYETDINAPLVTITLDNQGKLETAQLNNEQSNAKIVNDVLQEKLSKFNAIGKGLENDDVTSFLASVLNFSDLETKHIYFRFPHSAEGKFNKYFDKYPGNPFDRQKFLNDLDIATLDNAIVIIPIKDEEHFITLIVKCEGNVKTIHMLDSSLYFSINNTKALPEFIKAFNNDSDFEKFILNKGLNIQGEYGTCGFWTIAACIEISNKLQLEGDLIGNFETLDNDFEQTIQPSIAKRISDIIDGEAKFTLNKTSILTYPIPKNSTCINDELKSLKIGENSKISLARNSAYCTKIGTQVESAKKGKQSSFKTNLTNKLSNETQSLLPQLKSLSYSTSFSALPKDGVAQNKAVLPIQERSQSVQITTKWRDQFKPDSENNRSKSITHNSINGI